MNLQQLNFNDANLRMIVANDDSLFWLAQDVCGILGVDRTQVRRLDDDEKGVYSIQTPGGEQDAIFVNESGLYSLILTSRKPSAKDFKRWITHEVLPSIRRTGGYFVAQSLPAPSNQFDIMRGMIDALEAQERRIQAQGIEIQKQGLEIRSLEGKVALLGSDSGFRTVRAFAKEHGLKMSEGEARHLGKQAAALCRERGFSIGSVPDEKYGVVNSYPVEVLQELIDDRGYSDEF